MKNAISIIIEYYYFGEKFMFKIQVVRVIITL